MLKWCPGVGCGRIVKISHFEPFEIRCECGYCFCFKCGKDSHKPALCETVNMWIKKCFNDSETSNWLKMNTKDCPNCKVIIEKSGGCNHMTCKNSACVFEFCWVCLESWSSHTSATLYYCNRFDDDSVKALSEEGNLRAAILRFVHFYDRYMNHKNSLKLEKKVIFFKSNT